MTTKHITKARLHDLTRQATDVTSLQTDFGTWAAIITIDGQDYEVETPATDPTADATIRPVTRKQAKKAIQTDYRTVYRY